MVLRFGKRPHFGRVGWRGGARTAACQDVRSACLQLAKCYVAAFEPGESPGP
jgi:hypothetical protein